VPERKAQSDFAETAVLPEYLRPDRIDALADASAEEQGRYREYVRMLDEVPVLVDVVREPQRAAIRDFRLGQRPDVRKAPREDAALLREQHAVDVERQYAEYVEISAGLSATEHAAKTGPKRGGQKKRAKRAKRSARSKS
jgi:hypothetical protein